MVREVVSAHDDFMDSEDEGDPPSTMTHTVLPLVLGAIGLIACIVGVLGLSGVFRRNAMEPDLASDLDFGARDVVADMPGCSTDCESRIKWLRDNRQMSRDEAVTELEGEGRPCSPCNPNGGMIATPPDEQVPSTVKLEPFIGMAYTPDPNMNATHPRCDDFMSDWSEALWGPSGRNDLQVMKDMGVQAVRTYGIGSHLSHKAFLDHAQEVGLKVMPGFADYPYMKTGSNCHERRELNLMVNCIFENAYDCHDVIRDHYKLMLENGYTIVGEDGKRRYHPAISVITLINEDELKLHYSSQGGHQAIGLNANHAKVAVSATDGLLSAEDELGIVGDKPLLTATVSYAECPSCKSVYMKFPGCKRNTPMVCVLADYYHGFLDPMGFLDYTAKHDLFAMYKSRWVNSFNTPRPAKELCANPRHAVKDYSMGPLGKVPLYIGEFHDSVLSPANWKDDILTARRIIYGEDDGSCGVVRSALRGFNLFEYQVSYWKGMHAEGYTAMRYGFWGLGSRALGHTRIDQRAGIHRPYQVRCLFPARINGGSATKTDETNARSIIEALGGKWPEQPQLC